MNDPGTFTDDDLWLPPPTFRAQIEATHALAQELVEQVSRGQAVLVPVDELEFIARRLRDMTRQTVESLPVEVV